LPLPAEAVEIVYEESAHIGLNRAVDIVQGDALLEHFLAIDVEKLLRNAGQKGADQARSDLRPLRCGADELLQVLRKKCDVAPAAVFEHECESARSSHTWNRGRREAECESVRQLRELLVHVMDDFLVLRGPAAPIFPVVESHEKEAGVTRIDEAQEAEPDGARRIFDARSVHQHLLHFLRRRFCSFERCGVRELQVDEHVALVFDRQKAGWQMGAEDRGSYAGRGQYQKDDCALVDQDAGPAQISLGGAIEVAIERIEEPAQQTARVGPRLQQQSGERGAERQRIEGREHHRNRDGGGELLIEAAGDSGDKDSRYEYRRQHQGDSHQRARNLLHRLQRGAFRIEALLDVALHRLNHDNSVIDDQSDGEHDPEQGKRIYGKSEQREKDKGADQRHGDRKQRNQRGAPALEKEIDYDRNQSDGDTDCGDDLAHALRNRIRRIERHYIVDILRKSFFGLFHNFADTTRGIHSVGPRKLIDRDDRAWFSVEPARDRVILRSQIHSRDIAQVHDPAIRRLAHDDVAEFFGRCQAPLRPHRVRIFLAFRRRSPAHLARGVHRVLGLDGGNDLRYRNAQFRELIRLHPKAHRILAGAEHLHIADAGDARQLIVEVYVRVVGQELRIVGSLGRIE